MGVGTLALMGMRSWRSGQGPTFAPPNDLQNKVDAFLNQSKLEIPIKYDINKKKEIRELQLYYSEDFGRMWNAGPAAKPDTDAFFAFNAPRDGLYWFQMAIIDHQGNRNPPAFTSPAFRVMIDTKAPVVMIRAFERVGDEAIVSWEIQEPNPDWSKFQIDYKVNDSIWMAVQDAKGAFGGTTRFRIAQAGPATVRILAYDLAGNRAEMTKICPTRAAIGVSGTSIGTNVMPQTSMCTVVLPDGVNPPVIVPEPNGGVPIQPPEPVLTRPDPPIARQEKPFTPEPVVRNDPPIGSPLAVSPTTPRATRGVSLPSAQVINVARFDVAYDVEQKGPSGLSRAEVWITRDDGNSWNKWSTTEKTDSPVTVDLGSKNNPQVEGIYGIRIVLLSGAGLSNGPPVSGDAPEMRVDVDLTPPVVKIYEPIPDPNQKDTMIIRWQAVDQLLTILSRWNGRSRPTAHGAPSPATRERPRSARMPMWRNAWRTRGSIRGNCRRAFRRTASTSA